ncbi:MAG TPA: hypothetical protein VFA18_06195 [Gemmataceae bacterium]|nr:hypothetical protein [Gemmataceae bacterium]
MDTLLAVLVFLLPFLAVVCFLIFIDLALRYGTAAGYESPAPRGRQLPTCGDQTEPADEELFVVRVRRHRPRH